MSEESVWNSIPLSLPCYMQEGNYGYPEAAGSPVAYHQHLHVPSNPRVCGEANFSFSRSTEGKLLLTGAGAGEVGLCL